MIRLVAAGLLLGWVPGALALRLPLGDRDRRERLDWDERAFWAIVLSIAWSTGTAFALAVCGSYSLDRLLALNAAGAAILALALRSRLRYRSATGPRLQAIVPALLFGFALWLYHPPAEYIIGGKDPGVYLNEGVQIAQRGDVITRDTLVQSLPPDLRGLFIPAHYRRAYYGIRFMGFFVTDPASGAVVGQFPHLYPAAIAIGYDLDGLTGARHVSSTYAALGIVALFFLSARLVGRPAATVAAALLAVNVMQVWFARYPNSEIVAQVLILAGMLAFARAYIDGDRFFGPVAALLLGVSLFARIDGVLAIAAACVAAILLRVNMASAGFSFFGPMIAVCVDRMAVLQPDPLTLYAAPDWDRQAALRRARGSGRRRCRPLRRDRSQDARPISSRLDSRASWRSCSQRSLSTPIFFRVPSGRLAVHDANALRTYAWYVHPAALGAALIGLILVVWRRFWQDPAWLLAVAFYSLFFFYKIQIVPEHFWMARRFLPVILPATMLCIGAVLMEWAGTTGLATLRRTNLPRVALRIALAALIAWSFVESSRPILHHVEYAGIIARVESLASRIAVRRAPGRRVAQRIGPPHARPAAGVYLRQAGARPELAQAGQAGYLRSSSAGRGSSIARCISSAAAAPISSRPASASSRWRASAFRCPNTNRGAMPTRRACAARNSTTACIASSRRRRRTASSRSTSATRTTSTSSGSTRRNETGGARSAGRRGSHTCRSRR